MKTCLQRRSPLALACLLGASAAFAQTTIVVDNGSPGFSSGGGWAVSTAGSPTFAGTDHVVAQPLSTIVDNATPQFSTVGSWSVRSDGTGMYGADFRTASLASRFPHHYPVVIIDNKSNYLYTQGQSGWAPGQWLSGYYGEDFAYCESNCSNKVTSLTYQSKTLYGGSGVRDVRLSARWPVAPDNATNAVIRVRLTSVPGDPVVAQYTVNQRVLSGEWQVLGTFSVAGEDKLRIDFDATGANGRVIVDAVKLEQVESSPVTAARWNLPSNGFGDYEVYARWPAFAGAGTGTPVWTLVGGLGTERPGVGTLDLSQARLPGVWTPVGRINLRGSQQNYVLLEDSGASSSGVMAADAVAYGLYGSFPTAFWTATVPSQPTDVYVQWSADATRAPDAHYVVSHYDANCTWRQSVVVVDQRDAGAATGTYLGRITPGCNMPVRVQLLPGNGTGTLSADAVRFVSL